MNKGVSTFEEDFRLQTTFRTRISIVIPVYNQEERVSECIRRIKNVISQTFEECEIIVVNDGSIDHTLQVLKDESDHDRRVRVVSYAPNTGKGYAVKKGVLESKGKFVLFIDGDLDISPTLIRDYILELMSHDIVIASKHHPRSRVNTPSSRRFLSRSFNLIARILTGTKVSDTQVGLKAGRSEVMKEIFQTMLVKRYAFDVELLAMANLMNLRIKEMPVEMTLDRRFKVKDIVRMFVDVLAVAYRYRVRRYYQKRLEKYAAAASR